MSEHLALFPLSAVLFPGADLPLHIFEPRYRELVRDLMAEPAGSTREFGVIAIREGREVGRHGAMSLHSVGCTARLRLAKEHDDGRFDIVTQGVDRFRLLSVDQAKAYDRGEIERIAEADHDAGQLVGLVRSAFATYRAALLSGAQDFSPEADVDPRRLSYAIADLMVLDLHEKQQLLEAAGTAERLRAELRLLRRESTLVRDLRSVPAVELSRAAYTAN